MIHLPLYIVIDPTMTDPELCILIERTGMDSCISESDINSEVICIGKYATNAQTNQMTTTDLTFSLLSLFLAILAIHRLHSSDRFVLLTIILVLSGKFYSTHGMILLLVCI